MALSLRLIKQAKDLKRPSIANPLGRILSVYQDNPKSDAESMELKLGEVFAQGIAWNYQVDHDH